MIVFISLKLHTKYKHLDKSCLLWRFGVITLQQFRTILTFLTNYRHIGMSNMKQLT